MLKYTSMFSTRELGIYDFKEESYSVSIIIPVLMRG
jgi:hypothetical protein